jgi:c-di-GMP-binding flagellar brake protein YcgR
MQKKDQREFIRLKVHHLVKYKLLSSPGEAPAVLATIKDIGAGGVCLRTEEHLPVSSLIALKINFPNVATFISALAKVVWVKQRKKSGLYEVGLQFIDIEEPMRKAIDEQVKDVSGKLKKKKAGLFKALFGRGGE